MDVFEPFPVNCDAVAEPRDIDGIEVVVEYVAKLFDFRRREKFLERKETSINTLALDEWFRVWQVALLSSASSPSFLVLRSASS